MAERLIFDPSEIDSTRTQLDISDWVRAEGVDYGDAEIQAYMADLGYGASPVDFRVPNRLITIPLSLRAQGGTTFATIRQSIQAKVARWQQEGGAFKRVTSNGGTLFADVVNASLRFPGSWSQAHKDYDVEASLTLEALPDFYGNEVDLGDNTETSAAELIFTEANVDGDYPARVRVVVDEDQGQSQLGLMWGFRSRHYSSASTALLAYEAEALGPLDTAAKAALTGASGGTVVTHGTLSTNWTPVLSTNIAGTQYLTHTGTYRWWCRYRTTSGTAVALRGVYDVGDMTLPVENEPWWHPVSTGGTQFYIADLGELRLDAPPVGTHRWQGIVQGMGVAGGENVSIDRVWFQPVDDGAGVLRAPLNGDVGLAAYSARDGFDQSAGALAGKTAQVGGAWTGAGDATDWAVEATGHTAERTAVSDADPNVGGRIAISGVSAMTAQVTQVDFKFTSGAVSNGVIVGAVARYVDSSNWMAARVGISSGLSGLDVTTVVAGALTTHTNRGGVGLSLVVGSWYTIRVLADAAGRFAAWLFPQGTTPGEPSVLGQAAVLATGGALASGKPGMYDQNQSAVASTRNFDNFLAWVPTGDAVISASQSAQLGTTGIVREDSGGIAYGPVSWVEGDLPRLPVSGLEGRTAQVFLKASRGDFAEFPDSGIDDISARAFYRPCWLSVPGT